jgi:hypothetical protein
MWRYQRCLGKGRFDMARMSLICDTCNYKSQCTKSPNGHHMGCHSLRVSTPPPSRPPLVADEDGEIYLTMKEFIEQFPGTDERGVYQYEMRGMPFRPTHPHTYPKYACHRWFAGEGRVL